MDCVRYGHTIYNWKIHNEHLALSWEVKPSWRHLGRRSWRVQGMFDSNLPCILFCRYLKLWVTRTVIWRPLLAQWIWKRWARNNQHLFCCTKNIRTNVGVVIRNGTKLLVVISMALLRYTTVVLKKSEHQFCDILSDFSKKLRTSQTTFYKPASYFMKTGSSCKNQNWRFFDSLISKKGRLFDSEFLKRGPKPGCDVLLCLASCSCVLSNYLCCLSPYLLVICASHNSLG
jgi:hypothetical protein